ncbi:MAG: ribose 5-phosphate isomerase B [Acidobacteria bacterium 21-70-11]|nr:MAG: ribose 5-phosphate isomerase B [Acidobacteria bacterium 21-70-11]OYW05652.1 MAG: ribose 5-phosphate isomerase B [Acidobacteria bacterium 37-71-11]HQT93044.1 ribose 5-phosphate isomerase B [Thermoanaerobaculaceae bacterium]HQU33461.1 ribose 5-phosphate isomerase B [Thermoanaerobaculaceae bacterium]
MHILIASDHAGFDLKTLLVGHARDGGHEVLDLGTATPASVDYPDFAHDLAHRLLAGEGERGVLICGTGIGMSITANRHRGVRAALCHDAFTAELARRHNDANVLCMGGRTTGPGVAVQMLDIFLATPFEGGRHRRRVDKVEEPGTAKTGLGVRGSGPGNDTTRSAAPSQEDKKERES